METPSNPLGKARSFWAKPEGTTGMLVALGLGAAGLLSLNKILPLLISALENTLHATILGVGLAAVLWVLFDKRFRTLAWYGYQSLMRWITSWFVTVDPIGIVKNYILEMKRNLEKMQNQIGNLRGQITSLARTITTNEAKIDQCMKLAKEAEKQNKVPEQMLNTRQAGRLDESNKRIETLRVKLEVLYRVLRKMSETADVVIQDTEAEVECKEDEWKAITAGNAAMRSAMAIMRGDVDKKALFEQSMEFLVTDICNKVGEMDNFMDMSQKITSQIDLENGVFEQEGLKMLEQWEQKADSGALLKPSDKKRILREAADPSADIESLPEVKVSSYKNVLRRK